MNVSVGGYLSLHVSPVMNWGLVQGVPRLRPKIIWGILPPMGYAPCWFVCVLLYFNNIHIQLIMVWMLLINRTN